MRTTLDIEDDVLFAMKELAAKEHKTDGKVLSEFFRGRFTRMELLPVRSNRTEPTP